MLPGDRVFRRLTAVSFVLLLTIGIGGNILQDAGYIGPDGLTGPAMWIMRAVVFGSLLAFAFSTVPLGARAVLRRIASARGRAEDPRAADIVTLFVWAVWVLGGLIAIPAMIADIGPS